MSHASPSARSIRLATWNLWWLFGDGRSRQPAIGRVLGDLSADVIGIQEAWADERRTQAADLGARLGLHHVWSPAPDHRHWRRRLPRSDAVEVGNAVLSRWPITDWATIVLSEQDGSPAEVARTALLTRIATPAGTLDFCTTQLSSTIAGGSAIRMRQVARLRSWLTATRSGGHTPLAIGGDFNADPDSDEMRLLGGYKTPVADEDLVLVDAWRYRADHEPGYTWRLDNPHVRATGEPWSRPDSIQLAPTTAGLRQVDFVDVFGIDPIDGVHASDHAGVVADLRMRD